MACRTVGGASSRAGIAGAGVASAGVAGVVCTSSRGHLLFLASHPFAGRFACGLVRLTGERWRAGAAK